MKRGRFINKLISLLKVNDLEHLIPLFKKHLKINRGEVDNNFEDKFRDMLIKELKFSKYDSSRFLKGIYNVEEEKWALKKRNDKFVEKHLGNKSTDWKEIRKSGKYKNQKPVQGGSPGLGKGKS